MFSTTLTYLINVEYGIKEERQNFLLHQKCKEGRGANTFLSHEKSAWMGYKIWKNNKRTPSFTRQMRLGTLQPLIGKSSHFLQ